MLNAFFGKSGLGIMCNHNGCDIHLTISIFFYNICKSCGMIHLSLAVCDDVSIQITRIHGF